MSAEGTLCALRQVIVVDVRALGRKEGREQRRLVVERALRSGEQDNEAYYRNLRARMDRWGAVSLSGREQRSVSAHWAARQHGQRWVYSTLSV